ncbi:unnamed protein product, partial [Allacma fusca]
FIPNKRNGVSVESPSSLLIVSIPLSNQENVCTVNSVLQIAVSSHDWPALEWLFPVFVSHTISAMNANRRKWNSMDQLEDVVFDFKAGLAPDASNLRSLKHLSVSTPGMSIQDVNSDSWKPSEALVEFPVHGNDEMMKVDGNESVPVAQEIVPVTNKARQKKFDRQFSINETVLEYYSCALALDILLHGILYVTHNNFAFYSNVFGRVTKVLIPVSSIEKIQRSKTALIIPNAIHVHTNSEKYVFASFMSRENAYTQMQRVWTSFVSKSCGSKMNIIEQHLGLGKESETTSKKDKRTKNVQVAHSEGLRENNRKKEATGRKSVMFNEEPHEIVFADDENEPVSSVPAGNTQVEVDEYSYSEDEQTEPFTVQEERADNGEVPEDSQVLKSASEWSSFGTIT